MYQNLSEDVGECDADVFPLATDINGTTIDNKAALAFTWTRATQERGLG
jgi:hypothetical protein